MMHKQRWCLVPLVLAACAPSASQVASSPNFGVSSTPDISDAAHAFLVAFDSLRWEPFAAAWAPEATVFLPDGEQPDLVVGRPAVLAYFRALFKEVREAGKSTTLGILPQVRDLRSQTLDPRTALVTFQLGEGPQPGRRSLVWRWVDEQRAWQIVHLHASRLPIP